MRREIIHFQNDIILSCTKIQDFIAGHTFDSFLHDVQVYDAVLMNFVIIGEAAVHMVDEVRDNNPDIDWRTVVAMRNFLIHEYFEIDPKIVWETAQSDIPILLEKMKNLKI
jgi:uncharacterized protein with HEPN domain